MQANEVQWTQQEKTVAKAAMEQAFAREARALVQTVRDRAIGIDQLDDLWTLHDFLSARRHSLDGKYDRRESGMIFALAELIREGWLTLDDLAGLDGPKLAKIKALTRFF